MKPRLTCFGGVGEIGGNKFLLEDKDAKVLLDFGTGFADGADYFGGMIEPRAVNGAGDLFEFGLLPEVHGLYSEGALQNTELRYQKPEVDAVVVSHYHWDHVGRIGLVDEEIPIYCGETTALISEAYGETGSSPFDGHEVRRFRTGDKFRVGPLEFVPVHVDHSIPGAYGFVVYTSEGPIAYTGDFRFHGPAGEMTADFTREAAAAKPRLLLTEGTRVSASDRKGNMTEKAVLEAATKAASDCKSLVFSTFRGNDVDRINTFHAAAQASGRRLVVSMKMAALLEKLGGDEHLKVPKVGKDVDVYLRRKKTGKFDDSDYYTWERPYIKHGVSAGEVKKSQAGTFLHLEVWSFPELIDISPDKGGTYIHAATEPFNEEGEKEEGVVKNWVDHLGFSYKQLHASGHAPMEEVGELVRKVGAGKVTPIHTQRPDLFRRLGRGTRSKVEVPRKGVPIYL
ncbi:MAG: MBL fold metallo-hydrolase [Candidatus Gagatemarchaeaceae archaeon]